MLGNNRAQLLKMCERYVMAYNVTPHDDLRGELFMKSSTKLWSQVAPPPASVGAAASTEADWNGRCHGADDPFACRSFWKSSCRSRRKVVGLTTGGARGLPRNRALVCE